MVIIGVVGRIGAGKHEFMAYVEKNFQFQAIYSSENSETLSPKSLSPEILEQWDKNLIIGPLLSLDLVKKLKKKPYFHLIYIESDVSLRFTNHTNKTNTKLSLECFLELDEKMARECKMKEIRSLATFEIDNSTSSLKDFHKHIEENKKNILRPLKPSWEQYFMNIAFAVRTRSNCMRMNSGAILVRNDRIVSTGYTGTPQGFLNCNEGGCTICNENKKDLMNCYCIHAQENCIIEVGIAGSEGSTCYSTDFPCVWCLKVLIQGQIKKIVYFHNDEAEEDPVGMNLLKENGIETKRYFKEIDLF